MTYLDPDAMRQNTNWGPLIVKIVAAIAIVVVVWFAFIGGSEDGNVRPDIVQEPVADDPGTPSP